ncbi:DsbA family protein [bacterium]|nr:DsbA family protein [bacterium]
MIHRVLLIISLVLLPYTVMAEEPNVIGVYEKVPGKKFVVNDGKVEILEFLSFYCGHCYQFEKAVPVIKGNFPKKISWKIIPIYWGTGSSKPGEAYLLAEEEGKGAKMKKALFETFFIDKQDIGDIAVLEGLGVKVGMGFDFSRRLRAGDKAEEANAAIKMANEYGISETPTLVIAGNMKVSGHMLQHSNDLVRDNVIVMLKSILEK